MRGNGRSAGGQHGREKKQDRSNLSKHVQEPAIGTRSGSAATGASAASAPWLAPCPYKSYSLGLQADPPMGDRATVRRGCALAEPHAMRSVSGPPPGKGSMLGGKQQQFLATKV